MSDEAFKIEIVEGDVLDFAADVLALKYAQHYYGSDEAVSKLLVKKRVAKEDELTPAPGKHVWIDAGRVMRSPQVLLVGVPPLIQFGYTEIAEWAAQAMAITGRDHPEAQHIAITLHGPGYGLDEIEALHAELRGVVASVQAGDAPPALRRVSIVERKPARVERLKAALVKLAPETAVADSQIATLSLDTRHAWWRQGARETGEPVGGPRRSGAKKGARPVKRPPSRSAKQQEALATTVLETEAQIEQKPRAFVAMPFAPEMEDVFYYGIQNPVRQLGYICERVDQEAFTGGILEQVKMRIENAEIVIADLTGSNPNVYLEVGYAWGKMRPTVLVVNKKDDLRFDVSGQRCLKYQSIKDLEKLLTAELQNLGNRKPR
jgi:hypothetical protein